MSVRAPLLALALGLALAALPACYITNRREGRPVPDVSVLQVGRTTKAEALQRLGPPLAVRRQFDGDLLIWRRTASHLETLRLIPLLALYEHTSGDSDADIVALLFDREGLLRGAGTQLDIEP